MHVRVYSGPGTAATPRVVVVAADGSETEIPGVIGASISLDGNGSDVTVRLSQVELGNSAPASKPTRVAATPPRPHTSACHVVQRHTPDGVEP